ncbi:NADP-dependent alkenal double bond reductase P2 [Setaria viridis]|nr:NADP-dependent alkenal double bond reductase P2-like [Setaria viridis]
MTVYDVTKLAGAASPPDPIPRHLSSPASVLSCSALIGFNARTAPYFRGPKPNSSRLVFRLFLALRSCRVLPSPSMEVRNRYVAIRRHIEGAPTEVDFEVREETARWSPDSGEVLVRNLYLSIDPYQLNRMKRSSASHLAVDGILPGQRIAAYAAGEVVASASPEYAAGDVVAGVLGWEDYTLFTPSPAVLMSKVDASASASAAAGGFPLSHHISALGTSGMTAYGGLFEVCRPAKGDKVFVSAASGSVGSLVGQFAKLAGCYVVGCAGTKAKVDLLKDKLGFDDAFNYKEEPDLNAALKRYFPDGIDIYFENVGGEMLEAALANMNTHGRVAVSGVISEYTGAGRRAAPDLMEVIYKRITIRGFLAWDFLPRFAEFNAVIGEWIREGKVQVVEDVSDGLESVPSAFAALFQGQNVGKKLVKLA